MSPSARRPSPDAYFQYNYTEGAIATGVGFATSGLSSFAEASIEGAGVTGAYAIGANVAANTAIGTAGSVAQTALLNNLDNQNGSYWNSALYGGAFSLAGASISEIPAVSNLFNEAEFNAQSLGEQNIAEGIINTTESTGINWGTPANVTFFNQLGNGVVSNLSDFAPSGSNNAASSTPK